MSPKLRLLLFIAFGATLALAIGADLAEESYGLAVLAALAAAWVVIDRTSTALPDAWLLAATLVGYVVGNRGFAQIQPSNLIPLLPAEGVLLVATTVLIIRMAFKRTTPVQRDFLNYSILIWILLGLVRLPVDMERFGVIALRDFAMVYYAIFFFIAQAFGRQETSAKVLLRSLTLSFVCLIPVVVSIQISPEFLVDNLTWRGIPIIYHKSDLTATSLAAGFFWLWTRWEKSGGRQWLIFAATCLVLIGLMASPRAAMFAIAVTTILWLAAGRWRIAVGQLCIVSTAAILTLGALGFLGRDLKTSAPYSMYEHAVSIFDPAGSGSYINGDSGNPGDNNRFRLVWWKDVIDETLSTSPTFGLGFGSDLSARFLVDYDLLSDESFSARSPHSMVVTVFGRMGILGLVLWVAISAAEASMVWRLIKYGDADGRGLASIVAVVWISASFGVVLEGPMGAVIFWTAAGLASAKASQSPKPGEPSASRDTDFHDPNDGPVAKVETFDIKSAIQ